MMFFIIPFNYILENGLIFYIDMAWRQTKSGVALIMAISSKQKLNSNTKTDVYQISPLKNLKYNLSSHQMSRFVPLRLSLI